LGVNKIYNGRISREEFPNGYALLQVGVEFFQHLNLPMRIASNILYRF